VLATLDVNFAVAITSSAAETAQGTATSDIMNASNIAIFFIFIVIFLSDKKSDFNLLITVAFPPVGKVDFAKQKTDEGVFREAVHDRSGKYIYNHAFLRRRPLISLASARQLPHQGEALGLYHFRNNAPQQSGALFI
jgi:hypothetical protein